MNCQKCQSTKLKAFHNHNFDYVLYFQDNKWYYENPMISHPIFFGQRKWVVVCQDCRSSQFMDTPKEIYSADINKHNEITFDLDHTLIFAINPKDKKDFFENKKEDFLIELADEKYFVFFRPHLKEFLNYCIKRFHKINFATAASADYALEVIKNFNLPESKLGTIKSRDSWELERCPNFDREYMKTMNNSLMVEDKPLVVKGHGNNVIKVNHYWGRDDDNELLNIIPFLEAKEKKYKLPKEVNISIELFLRKVKIPLVKFPIEKIQKILDLSTPTDQTLNSYPVHTSRYQSFLSYDNKKQYISIIDLDYSEYCNLFKLISNFTNEKPLSEKEYSDLMDESKHKLNF